MSGKFPVFLAGIGNEYLSKKAIKRVKVKYLEYGGVCTHIVKYCEME